VNSAFRASASFAWPCFHRSRSASSPQRSLYCEPTTPTLVPRSFLGIANSHQISVCILEHCHSGLFLPWGKDGISNEHLSCALSPISMTTDSGVPPSTKLRAPDVRKSWMIRSGNPSAMVAAYRARRRFVILNTRPSPRNCRGKRAECLCEPSRFFDTEHSLFT
jgi:hypothetical protein